MSSRDIYEKIGIRLKEKREQAGITQAEFANQIGTSVTYISAVERGISFPRGDKLVAMLNSINASADSIFCDVVSASSKQRSCELYDMLFDLPINEQYRILETLEFLIQQSKKNM